MGMGDSPLLTHSAEEYGAVAAMLGTNRSFADEQRRRVRARRAHLFDCSESVAEWTRFLVEASSRPRPTRGVDGVGGRSLV